MLYALYGPRVIGCCLHSLGSHLNIPPYHLNIPPYHFKIIRGVCVPYSGKCNDFLKFSWCTLWTKGHRVLYALLEKHLNIPLYHFKTIRGLCVTSIGQCNDLFGICMVHPMALGPYGALCTLWTKGHRVLYALFKNTSIYKPISLRQ